MIEWWQALLISLSGAILVGITALVVLYRQLSHDASIHAARLVHERALKRDDFLRAAKRDRLQPVFELLDDIDKRAAAVIWQEVAKGLPDDQDFREFIGLDSGKVTEEQVMEWAKLAPKVESVDLVLRSLGLANRLSDKRLAADIMFVVITLKDLKRSDMSQLLGMPDLHSRLEAEAARI